MDGSGIDFVVIPVVVLPILAFWLYGMFYAGSHPTWPSGPSGAQREIAVGPASAVVPPQVAAVILPEVAEGSAAPAATEAP